MSEQEKHLFFIKICGGAECGIWVEGQTEIFVAIFDCDTIV